MPPSPEGLDDDHARAAAWTGRSWIHWFDRFSRFVRRRYREQEIKARQATDAARKATATFAIFTALSLLIGAFVAMAAAAFGGSLRDEY